MQKILTVLLAAVLVLFPMTALASGESVDSNALIERAKEYDGKEIIFSGEAIGDIMKRGEYAWINVSDGNNAMGVWVKTTESDKIGVLGEYKAIGDKIRVTGVFHRACAEHGGDMDIHAASVEVQKNGQSNPVAVSPIKAAAALILSAAAVLLLGFLYNRIRKTG